MSARSRTRTWPSSPRRAGDAMKWWLIAWREIRWEVFLDRASLLRTAIFVFVPMLFILSNRSIGPGGPGGIAMIVAARVRSSRAAQQIAGLIIALSIALFATLGFVASQVAGGWPLLALGLVLLAFDVAALEVARRVWQRGEVIGRI